MSNPVAPFPTVMVTTEAWLPGRLITGEDGRPRREAPFPAPPLLTEEELIRFLRLDEIKDNPKRTIGRYRGQRKNPMPCVQIGRHRRYPIGPLMLWVQRQAEVKPT